METTICEGGLDKTSPPCRKRTVIILPVNTSCNLDCTYCYHGDEREKPVVIPFEVLLRIYDEISKYAENVTFLWHGGEPLLAGTSFLGGQ